MTMQRMSGSIFSLVVSAQLVACLGSNSPTSASLSSTGLSSANASSALSASSSSAVAVTLGTTPTVSVLNWNGAKGAYSIIMDDFCGGTQNSEQWADSVAYAHQLNIGFAIIAGSCATSDWAIANAMIKHGSEPVNHSSTHSCADTTKCGGSTPWTSGSAQLLLETDSSTQTIQTYTGMRPTFFAYPNDVATMASQAELVTLHYLGARDYNLRTYGGKGFNKVATLNGMTMEYDARQPASLAVDQLYGMDAYADSAASKGVWALRETHGVDDGSWAAWPADSFVEHVDHLAALRDQGLLWVAPPSRVIRYVYLTKRLTWNVVATPSAYEVQWSTAADTLARYAVSLRLQVSGSWKATQGGGGSWCDGQRWPNFAFGGSIPRNA